MIDVEWIVDPSPPTRAERRARAIFERGGAVVGNLVAGALLWAMLTVSWAWHGTLTPEIGALMGIGMLMLLEHAWTLHGYNHLVERYDAELRHRRSEDCP